MVSKGKWVLVIRAEIIHMSTESKPETVEKNSLLTIAPPEGMGPTTPLRCRCKGS